MGVCINVGNESFRSILKSAYVDKTNLIQYLNSIIGTKQKLVCSTRPRRFGKTFAVQMINAYYDKSCDSKILFDQCEISKSTDYTRFLNKYRVIYLDITFYISITDDVHDVVSAIEKQITKELIQIYPDLNPQDSLIETLYQVSQNHNEKLIMLIDEWDALFREAKTDISIQQSYIDLLRSLFKNQITDSVFDLVYMTGILPIKRYGNQSAVSDFQESTMLLPGALSKFIGFTEDEVKSLCVESGMDFNLMKYWYDGYSFPQVKSIYSPNSVIEAINHGYFGSYWSRTETYESLSIYIDMNFDGLKEAVIQMIAGDRIRIEFETFQNDMINIKSKDDVLTLLVHLGYLSFEVEQKSVYIPNEEVRKEFLRSVTASKHHSFVQYIKDSEDLLMATLSMDCDVVAHKIQNIHKRFCNPLNNNNEAEISSVIRQAYIATDDDYLSFEELPSGHGYADILYLPKHYSTKPALLIELKWNKSPKQAIAQIKTKDYPSRIKDYGGTMLLVGITYDSLSKHHQCEIEWFNQENKE